MDFRLKVFEEVAKTLSFTRASKSLMISQPAISNHIKELETIYKVRLFNREGSRISLTPEGEIFRGHVAKILADLKHLEYDMGLLSGRFQGEMKIGASTTIAQYLITPLLGDFVTRFSDVKFTLISGNSEFILKSLEDGAIDVGLVEGSVRDHNFKYTHLCKDELVLVTSVFNNSPEILSIDQITTLPLVLRENGSGTLDVIHQTLGGAGVKISNLNILMQIDNTEGIKQFLVSHKKSYAIVSIISVLKELKGNELKIVDIDGVEFVREFAFVTKMGEYNDSVEKFIQFAKVWKNSNYNF